jgi:hypothetical protein
MASRAKFACVKRVYAVNRPVPVDTQSIDEGFSNSTLVTVKIFYGQSPQSPLVPADVDFLNLGAHTNIGPGTVSGLWSGFNNNFEFVPKYPGFYSVTLVGVILAGSAVGAVVNLKLESVCVVSV